MKSRFLLIGLCCILLVAGCGKKSSSSSSSSSQAAGPPVKTDPPAAKTPHWPAPDSGKVVSLAQAAGITVGNFETLQHHVHSHLDVFIDGQRQIVPAGIGIAIAEPEVHTFPGPGYGGITTACANPCISPLHTHEPTGVLHTESATNVDHTLGQIFIEWDVKLTSTCIGEFCTPAKTLAVYVNGKAVPFATAAAIRLTNHEEIAIVIGTPPSSIPNAGDFSTD